MLFKCNRVFLGSCLLVINFQVQAVLYECTDGKGWFLRTKNLSECHDGKGVEVGEAELNPFLAPSTAKDNKSSQPKKLVVFDKELKIRKVQEKINALEEASQIKINLLKDKKKVAKKSVSEYKISAQRLKKLINQEKHDADKRLKEKQEELNMKKIEFKHFATGR